MSAQVPARPLQSDPLIAEAKHRARRRRRLVATVGTALAIGAVGAAFALRSHGPRPAGPPGGAFAQTSHEGRARTATGRATEARLRREIAELRARQAALLVRLRAEQAARKAARKRAKS